MIDDPAPRPERTIRASPMDAHVGARIRLRRTLLGLSQEKLGDAVSLTFQQIQKYERGVNRVGAARLFDLSRVLDVPVSFFYDDMPEDLAAEYGGQPSAQAARRAAGFAEQQEAFGAPDPATPGRGAAGSAVLPSALAADTRELVDAFDRSGDPAVRRSMLEMIKSVAGARDPSPA